MRVEDYTVGSHLHVIKRGARGIKIVQDDSDRWRFLRMLFLLNDKHFSRNWVDYDLPHIYSRPASWPERETIVDILAYTLMPNHVHLILREKEEGGMSLFMKRLGQSITNHANEKYEEKGSLWQGAFRSKTIDSDQYIRYVAAYVMVKNSFELYPEGGLAAAKNNFEKVWSWAVKYNFSSLGDYAGVRKDSLILNKGLLGEIFVNTDDFKNYSFDVIQGRNTFVVSAKDLE